MDGTQHTRLQLALDAAPAVLERKVKADGTTETYLCRLLARAPSRAVVGFPLPAGGSLFRTAIAIPPGAVSLGFFWRRRPYVVYRFRASDGTLIGHRVDAARVVRLQPSLIEFRDLILDWWLAPDGRLLAAEDRAEFDHAVAAGLLGAEGIAFARRAEHVALAPKKLLAELRAVEAELGLLP